MLLPEGEEIGGGAGRPMTEAEVGSHHDLAGAQALGEQAAAEVLRGERRELPVEGHRHHFLHPQFLQQDHFHLEGREKHGRVLRVQHRIGMGFEGHHRGHTAHGARGVHRHADDALVPAMHPVEGAHGHRPGPPRKLGDILERAIDAHATCPARWRRPPTGATRRPAPRTRPATPRARPRRKRPSGVPRSPPPCAARKASSPATSYSGMKARAWREGLHCPASRPQRLPGERLGCHSVLHPERPHLGAAQRGCVRARAQRRLPGRAPGSARRCPCWCVPEAPPFASPASNSWSVRLMNGHLALRGLHLYSLVREPIQRYAVPLHRGRHGHPLHDGAAEARQGHLHGVGGHRAAGRASGSRCSPACWRPHRTGPSPHTPWVTP